MTGALRRVLIVGASIAGLSAARALRRAGYDGELILLGAESEPPYKRPPLSKEVLTGTAGPAAVELRRGDDLGLDLRLGQRAVGLDLAARQVMLAGGPPVGFDGLVIATGAAPVHPWRDRGLAGVHTLRTLADALALRAGLARARRLAVIGAGFVGAEVASAARQQGLDVTMIELLRAPHAAALGHEVGSAAAALHREHGTRLRLGTRVAGLAGTGRVTGVVLDTGEVIPADLVLVGIGAVPATGWLAGSGVALAAGVVCDSACAVLDTGGAVIDAVVAAGDAARWHHPLFGADVRVEHWDNAVAQGKAAALRLLGDTRPYAPVPYFWTDQYDSKLQFAGLARPGDQVTITEGSLAARSFVAAYGRGGVTVGAAVMNLPHRMAAYHRLIGRGAAFPPEPPPSATDLARPAQPDRPAQPGRPAQPDRPDRPDHLARPGGPAARGDQRSSRRKPVKIWIDQDQCTSSGLCEVISPEVFRIEDDGLAHLRGGDDGPAGRRVYAVPAGLHDQVREAADQCPGECIYVEEPS